MSKKLYLLDAYALIYRSYYAFIKNPRFNSKGLNTSAIFGFTNTLIELIAKENPTHIAVVFDPPYPTFRHKIYKKYKALPIPPVKNNNNICINILLVGYNGINNPPS